MSQPTEGPRDLANAYGFSTGDGNLDRFLRGSMVAGLGQDRAVARQLRDLDLRNDAELDLHLYGEAEEQNTSRADFLGRFLKEATDAVKQIAKDLGGLRRHSANLWVQAPAPGSMRLLMRTVEPKRATPKGTQSLPGTDGRTLDALAVLRLVALMEQSRDVGMDSPLAASLQDLRTPARNAVASLAKVVGEAGWHVSGRVEVRGHEPASVEFDSGDARRLFKAAKTESVETREVPFTGQIDGWSWSGGTFALIPDRGRMLSASVPPSLSAVVAAIGARPNNRVRGVFLMTTTYPEGSSNAKRQSYALRNLAEIPPGEVQDALA